MGEEKTGGKVYLTDSEREEIRKNGCKHVGVIDPDNWPCYNCEQTARDCTCDSCRVSCIECGAKLLRLSCRLVRLAYDERQALGDQAPKMEKKRRFGIF
jgi:hypothetical protein